MATRSTLIKKVFLPHFFSMTLSSDYGRVASKVFFGDHHPDTLAEIEARISSCTATAEMESLCHETISFHHPAGPASLRVNVANNNQLLGASRQIREFRHGYEPEIHAAIDLLTPKDAVIYDIGSNWGPISFQAVLRSDFCGQVFSFEPQQQAFQDMEKMITALSLEKRMFPHNLALSDTTGYARMTDPHWRGNVAISAEADTGAGAACRMVRLDDLSLPDPHLIKIDVEGHETQVLAGASALLERARPLVIFEDWSHLPREHYQQLQDYNYVFYVLGWFDPFLDRRVEAPPFHSAIQLLALQPMTPEQRAELPERINVLASPCPVSLTS